MSTPTSNPVTDRSSLASNLIETLLGYVSISEEDAQGANKALRAIHAAIASTSPDETTLQRKAQQVLRNALKLEDHFTYCDRTMGDSHGCTCGMAQYAKLLRELEQPPTTGASFGQDGVAQEYDRE